MYLIDFVDFGDAMIETKQLAPGTKPDGMFQFGLISGSPEEDVDLGRLMLAKEPQPE